MKNNWARWVFIVAFGIFFNIFLNGGLLDSDSNGWENVRDYFLTIFLSIIVFQGLFYITRRLDKKYPWTDKPVKRFWRQILFTCLHVIVSASFVGIVSAFVFFQDEYEEHGLADLMVPLTIALLLFALVFSLGEMALYLGRQWHESHLKLEQFKKQSAEMRFEMLKQQVNPHFLFNSLNTLSSLVYQDRDQAARFIRQLSRVFRYVLEHTDSEIVSLQDELETLKPLIYLLETRFDGNLKVEVSTSESVKESYIAPMSLQMLVENAIKHNIVSESQPLKVRIAIEQDRVVVTNNFQPKNSTSGPSGIGLKNITARYAYLSNRKVEIINDGKDFVVGLPLLTKERIQEIFSS